MIITADTPVRDIVVEEPATITLLEQLGIDYCCGGQQSLATASTKRNHDVGTVIGELNRRANDNGTSGVDWQTAPLKDLIAHIVQRHHAFARQHLSLVRELAERVKRLHGPTHPEIYKISEEIAAISAELTHHFSCEETVLFPHIERLGNTGQPVVHPVFANIQQPITKMMMDHNQTGDELRTLREATRNYVPPPDACKTFRALYRALEELERDLHRHIHLENNILFPRALKLEGEVPSGVSNKGAVCGCGPHRD